MENKITRYNQRLKAIIGTLILVGVGLLIVAGGYALIDDIISTHFRKNAKDNALIADDQDGSDDLNTKATEQEISFSKPRLIDTLNSIYLIRVTHVNTETAELHGKETTTEGLFIKLKGRDYSYFKYSGLYNNIIIYDKKNDQKTHVFRSKVCINSIQNHFFKGKQYLLISGTMHDTNKDGKLKDSDLQTFFLYNIQDQKLKTVGFEGYGLIDHYILYDSDEIVLRFGEDKDKNGMFKKYVEPIILKKLSISKNKTEDLIGSELKDSLQKLID